MPEYRKGAHTIYDIQYYVVWVTKYRYKVLRGEIAERAREILRQICMSRDIKILQGHVSNDHIHMLISCPPTLSPAKIAQYLKGVSSHKLQDEFPSLNFIVSGGNGIVLRDFELTNLSGVQTC
jgi:putative transposase